MHIHLLPCDMKGMRGSGKFRQGVGVQNVLMHQRISQRVVQTSVDKEFNCFPSGSLPPVFLRIHKATCDIFQGEWGEGGLYQS